MSAGWPTGMRVHVDGSTHPTHDDAPSLSATLRFASGEICEVQVARVGSELNVVIAGDRSEAHVTREGYLTIRVAPVKRLTTATTARRR